MINQSFYLASIMLYTAIYVVSSNAISTFTFSLQEISWYNTPISITKLLASSNEISRELHMSLLLPNTTIGILSPAFCLTSSTNYSLSFSNDSLFVISNTSTMTFALLQHAYVAGLNFSSPEVSTICNLILVFYPPTLI